MKFRSYSQSIIFAIIIYQINISWTSIDAVTWTSIDDVAPRHPDRVVWTSIGAVIRPHMDPVGPISFWGVALSQSYKIFTYFACLRNCTSMYKAIIFICHKSLIANAEYTQNRWNKQWVNKINNAFVST